MNFAQNLLFPSSDPAGDTVAVIEANELSRRPISWDELRERVRRCSTAMRSNGIGQGDRVAGVVANNSNALAAMLSATTLGAIWSGVSPDTGVHAILDRLQQIEPKILFVDNAVIYNGKVHPTGEKLQSIISGLPQLEICVIFETISSVTVNVADFESSDRRVELFAEFLDDAARDLPLVFDQLPADHPVYILYSSGTTGKPKCIVHGAIGTLIQHKKEHAIQSSMNLGDRLFYFTTCTWMMWHWLVSALATGVTIIVYDGSPFQPLDEHGAGEMAMPKLIEELKITHFGTSAKYLSILEQKEIIPKDSVNLSTLKAIYSTGSPLAPSVSTISLILSHHDFSPFLSLVTPCEGGFVIEE